MRSRNCAAKHLIGRDVPRLARQIPERHLDGDDAAGLPRVAAELLQLAEDLVDAAGVLAEDAALEKERIGLTRAVADLAVARDALVGVDADDRTGHRGADDGRKAQVGDLQLRRLRGCLHVLRDGVEVVVGDEAVGEGAADDARCGGLEERAAIEVLLNRRFHGGPPSFGCGLQARDPRAGRPCAGLAGAPRA